MQTEILETADLVAQRAAAFIAEEARRVVALRGSFVMAVSGGTTPWVMLRQLAKEDVPWPAIQVFQVDERIAPAGDPDRNLTHLQASLLDHAPLRTEQIQAMPVEESDLESATRQYARILRQQAGSAAILDLVHLGLGPDGHTASLVPGDPVLAVDDQDVAITMDYKGRKRMTLTFPAINRSRRILWVVVGNEKAEMLSRMLEGDQSIPAGRVSQQQSVVLADRAASRNLLPVS